MFYEYLIVRIKTARGLDYIIFGDTSFLFLILFRYLFTLAKIKIMPLTTVFAVLIVVGVILWLINTYLPMDQKIKNILNAVAVIVVVIWLLQAFGILDSIKNLKI